jgi:hypothetical protein
MMQITFPTEVEMHRNNFLSMIFVVALTASIISGAALSTFTGSTPCNACKNCKYCKHCAKEGGTCGVCAKSTSA